MSSTKYYNNYVKEPTKNISLNFNNIIIGSTSPPIEQITQQTIEQIFKKYSTHNSRHITDILDIHIISKFIYATKRLKSLININSIKIEDIIPLIVNSEIIYFDQNSIFRIFRQGKKQDGFYILIKGDLLINIENSNSDYLNNLDNNNDLIFKEQILKEYNLTKEDVVFDKKNKIKSSIFPKLPNANNLNDRKISIDYLLLNMARESLHNKEKDKNILDNYLCMYKSKNIFEDTIFFGGIYLLNYFFNEKEKIHLSSAYIDNSKENNEIILLHINNEALMEFKEKLRQKNKLRTKFLYTNLGPLNEMTSRECDFFISNIKLIYLKRHEKLIIDDKKYKNTFFLIYEGVCCDNIHKNIIHDKGDFLYLKNLFQPPEKNTENYIYFYPKSSYAILFIIELSFLSKTNFNLMQNFLSKIYINQTNIRDIYENKKQRYMLIKHEKESFDKKKFLSLDQQKNVDETNFNNDNIKNCLLKIKNSNKNNVKIGTSRTNQRRSYIVKNNNDFESISEFSIPRINSVIINNDFFINYNDPLNSNMDLSKIKFSNNNSIDNKKHISSKLIRNIPKITKKDKIKEKKNIIQSEKNNIRLIKKENEYEYENIMKSFNIFDYKKNSKNNLVSKKIFLSSIKNFCDKESYNKNENKNINNTKSLNLNIINGLKNKNYSLSVLKNMRNKFKKMNYCSDIFPISK